MRISKQDVFGTELAGAELSLTGVDVNGNKVVFSVDNVIAGENAQLISRGNTTILRWISGNSETFISNLPNGTYTLHESVAPNGYEVTTDITFTIADNTAIGDTVVDGNKVVMVDDAVKPEIFTDVRISKQDVFGGELAGAELTLMGKDANGNSVVFDTANVSLGENAQLISNGTTSELQWISGNTSTYISSLPNGTYTLHEVASPDGYIVSTDITFTITDGTVTGRTVVDGNTVVMVDETVTAGVKISKQDVFGTELAGATLTLTGKDAFGNDVVFDTADVIAGLGSQIISNGTTSELQWVSGSYATYVNNLPDGTYTLHEVVAPNGYEVTTDITFTIENGEVSGETVVDGNTVVMVDEITVTGVRISKQDVFGTELAGAELTLTGRDVNGNSVVFDTANVTAGLGAEIISNGTTSTLQWISGSYATFINNLPDGTYILHEVNAPDGYDITTDITFTISRGVVTGETVVDGNTVVMVDEMIFIETTTIIVFEETTTTTVLNGNVDGGEDEQTRTRPSGEVKPDGQDNTRTTTDGINISKQDIYGTEVVGAELTLTGKDVNGNDIVFSLDNVAVGEDGKLISTEDTPEVKWISGSTPTYISNIADGTYTLHEVSAPNGYEVATDIAFTVTNGVVTGETVVNSDTVVMIDERKVADVKISKQDVFGEEIKGAELTLTGKDKDGNDIIFTLENVTVGENGQLISTEDSKELKWISGETATLISNLPDGTYTLHEVNAPDGYEFATDITFTIKDGVLEGEAVVNGNTVVMVDEAETKASGNGNGSSNNGSNSSSSGSSSNKNTSSSSGSSSTSSTSTSSPRTGVSDMSAVIFLMAIAVGMAFISRSNKKDND